MQFADNSGPSSFNNPGPLQIGWNTLSNNEEKTHFALWAISKAPLMVSANQAMLSNDSLAILSNQWLINVNQDELGQQAKCKIGCDWASNSTLQGYQAQVMETGESNAYIVVVVVNWQDSAS